VELDNYESYLGQTFDHINQYAASGGAG